MRDRMMLQAALLALTVLGAGCAHETQPAAQLPSQPIVRAPADLRVAVVGITKRPLAAGELAPFERAGLRWEYGLQIADTGKVGVRLEQVQNSVRSLSGVASTKTIPLPSRVEPNGTTTIDIRAVLSTSNPEEPGNLRGVQELVFLGRDDQGRPVQFTVEVPLS